MALQSAIINSNHHSHLSINTMFKYVPGKLLNSYREYKKGMEKMEREAIRAQEIKERAAKRREDGIQIPCHPVAIRKRGKKRKVPKKEKGRKGSSFINGRFMFFSVLLLLPLIFLARTVPISPSFSTLYGLGEASSSSCSNGEKMGLPIIPPLYSQNGTVDCSLNGLNFGSSLATIINTDNLGFQSLNHQLRQVFEAMQILQLQVGQNNSTELFQSSVFYISLGKDDYTHLFQHDGAFTNILVKQMIWVVKNLYNANARKIICLGTGPLGCSPRALWESCNSTATPTNQTSAVNLTNSAEDINPPVLQYNARLSVGLLELNNRFFDAEIIFCDGYQGMAEVVHNAELYGFSNVRDACCGLGRYGTMVGCVSEDLTCRDPSQHFWWDFYNPTQEVSPFAC